MAARMNLVHVSKIFSVQRSETSTADLVEHQGLDPWVQWVGVHCGKPTTDMASAALVPLALKTFHKFGTAWPNRGYTWGAWGAMNAPLGDPSGCKFFMPDPWSFDKKATRPDFSLIFLNHIAHLQHQFWAIGDEQHPEMSLGLKMIDAMFAVLLGARSEGEALIVMNGLKQENIARRGFHVCRQINPDATLRAIGVEHGRVEQCMTHDAHVLFHTISSADAAQARLERCQLSGGHAAFFVERESPLQVFYQLAFEHRVAPSIELLCDDCTLRFDDLFQLILLTALGRMCHREMCSTMGSPCPSNSPITRCSTIY